MGYQDILFFAAQTFVVARDTSRGTAMLMDSPRSGAQAGRELPVSGHTESERKGILGVLNRLWFEWYRFWNKHHVLVFLCVCEENQGGVYDVGVSEILIMTSASSLCEQKQTVLPCRYHTFVFNTYHRLVCDAGWCKRLCRLRLTQTEHDCSSPVIRCVLFLCLLAKLRRLFIGHVAGLQPASCTDLNSEAK